MAMPVSYGYKTQVGLPGGQQYNYSGTQTASGGTLFTGMQLTPPGPFRRITVGFNLNAGGLDSWLHPVIPSDANPPFSTTNLQASIQRGFWNHAGWHPSLSPYIEHEIGTWLGNRCRLGYEYWSQSGQYHGTFFPYDGASDLATYQVKLNYGAHLVRFSVNNIFEADDTNPTTGAPRPRQRYGLIQQAGILAGTHRTFMIFLGVGAFWRF